MNGAINFQNAKNALSPVWTRLSTLVVEKGAGSYVYTTCGKKLLDFTSGIGVLNTGHCHPKIVKAAQEQVANLAHMQMGIAYHRPVLEMAEELSTVVPEGMDQFFFSNSGAEAVEGAIKLARHATGKSNIISFQNSFHGRTIGAMSVTNSKSVYRAGYAPLMAGVHVAPYPYPHRCPIQNHNLKGPNPSTVNGRNGGHKTANHNQSACSDYALQQLEHMLHTQTAPSETAAILIEPVLGEGGYIMPPKSFMQGIRRICDENKILLIADEVQTGFGRTGKWFACEHFNIKPDILVFAKALSSGFPLSGIAAPDHLHKLWAPGSHGGTMGANAVACAAAKATIQVIKEEGLVEKAEQRGKQLRGLLHEVRERYPHIADIRGPGLMVGIEFFSQKDNDHPFPGHNEDYAVKAGFAGALTKKAVDHGMLILSTGAHETVRFIPPLNVSKQELETGVEIFERSIRDVLREHQQEDAQNQLNRPFSLINGYNIQNEGFIHM